MRPSRIRKAALTEVPMIPPMVLKLSNLDEIAAAVAATTMEVMITILTFVSLKKRVLKGRNSRGMAEREEGAYGDGLLARRQ